MSFSLVKIRINRINASFSLVKMHINPINSSFSLMKMHMILIENADYNAFAFT